MGRAMLSLPGLKGLMKAREQKQYSHIDLATLLEDGVFEPGSVESLLIHLAGKLDLEVLALIDRIGSEAHTIMLDTFHINIEESSLDGPVRAVGDRLGHVHVFENHRGLFGTGHVDLGQILRATLDIGYQAYWVFGDFSSNPTQVRATAIVDFLRRGRLL